jgi:hypothetical protein
MIGRKEEEVSYSYSNTSTYIKYNIATIKTLEIKKITMCKIMSVTLSKVHVGLVEKKLN